VGNTESIDGVDGWRPTLGDACVLPLAVETGRAPGDVCQMWLSAPSVPMAKTSMWPSGLRAVASSVTLVLPPSLSQLLHGPPGEVCQM
jgi:hypothetical protein